MPNLPIWMRSDQHLGKEGCMRDNPRGWIERARWISRFEEEEDRLALLMQAPEIEEARSDRTWGDLAADYPTVALEDGELTYSENRDVTVRAIYLEAMVTNLMERNGAPEAAIQDLRLLLRAYRVRGADKRAAAQEALFADPTASNTEIASRSGLDGGQVSKDLKSGRLARPRYALEFGDLISKQQTCSSAPAGMAEHGTE